MWQNQTKLQIHVCGYWSRFFNFFYKVQSHHRATCRVSGLLYTPPPRKLSRAFYFSRISCVAVATPKSLKREPFTRRWSLVEQIKKIIQFCFDFLWTGKFVLFIAFVIIKIVGEIVSLCIIFKLFIFPGEVPCPCFVPFSPPFFGSPAQSGSSASAPPPPTYTFTKWRQWETCLTSLLFS